MILSEDGQVYNINSGNLSQLDVDDWEDIIDISVGEYHAIGLKPDGTVIEWAEYQDGISEKKPLQELHITRKHQG